MSKKLGEFIKQKRKEEGLKQEDVALYCNVSKKFLSELENGKDTLKLDKVNDVLNLFGYEVGPIKKDYDE